MAKRTGTRILLALAACVIGYLLVAGGWAWSTFDQAIRQVPTAPTTPLSARQIALLALVEDPDFFDHIGVSLAPGQGLATISSAVARDVYLTGPDVDGFKGTLQALYRRVFDCCKKIDLGRDVMAVVLNARLSKDRQLALYVSQVYMGTHRGQQIRGLPHAAQSYLGKTLTETTDDEFLGLVAMIKAPNHFHPDRNPDAHAARVARLAKLVSGKCKPGGWFDTSLEQCSR